MNSHPAKTLTLANGLRATVVHSPGASRAAALLRQAAIALDQPRRLAAARVLFRRMFNEDPPATRSVEQLRGMEGARVRQLYADISRREGVVWVGRDARTATDPVNRAISFANAALYGLVEAVVIALGYAPSIGITHTGDPRSFVFDIADCVKFQHVTPLAMRLAKESPEDIEGRARRACRDMFRETRMAECIVETIEDVLQHG